MVEIISPSVHSDATHPCFISKNHCSINKRGSQKDSEQKKNGNYFFYDDGEDEEAEEDFDDI